jgi:hypothetical protein
MKLFLPRITNRCDLSARVKLERLNYNPGELLEFYERGFSSLGALCERTWHDRLEVVAEGQAARVWDSSGSLHEVELRFAAADATSARDAAREVFPGCPLTFQLADALRPGPLTVERCLLAGETGARFPDPGVAEKLWRFQFPETHRWKQAVPFKMDFHFSLLVVARCEIQAIDQHWSLHRAAMALCDGEVDEGLARDITFCQPAPTPLAGLDWPAADPARWRELLAMTLQTEIADDVARVRLRQENSLRRELVRIEEYFGNYEQELLARTSRSSNQSSKLKTAERLTAARAEHARRRADQVARHEIRVHTHLDALLLVAESGWRTRLQVEMGRENRLVDAIFVPRSRRWHPFQGLTK